MGAHNSVVQHLPSVHGALDLMPSMGRWGGVLHSAVAHGESLVFKEVSGRKEKCESWDWKDPKVFTCLGTFRLDLSTFAAPLWASFQVIIIVL